VTKAGGHTWQIAGMGPLTLDTQDSVLAAFPLAILATALCVFVLLGFAFGSVMVPLRSVLTTSATLAFVYAMLQIVHVSFTIYICLYFFFLIHIYIGFAFGSVMVPLRSVLTTSATLAFVYTMLQIVVRKFCYLYKYLYIAIYSYTYIYVCG